MFAYKSPKDIAMQTLKNGIMQQAGHHLYILVAPTLAQQRAVYHWYIKQRVCTNMIDGEPCGLCNNCQQVDADSFLNSTVIRRQEGKKSIGVEAVSELQEVFSTTSSLDEPRFFCIEHADSLTLQAANSLLKFLEEPSDNTFGFLFVANEQKLLSTIVSRGQLLRLGEEVLPQDVLEQINAQFEGDNERSVAVYLCQNHYELQDVCKYEAELQQAIVSYANKITVGSPLIVAQTEIENAAKKTKTGTMILEMMAFIMLEHFTDNQFFKEAQAEVRGYMRENAIAIFLSVVEALRLKEYHATMGTMVTKMTLELLKKLPENANN